MIQAVHQHPTAIGSTIVRPAQRTLKVLHVINGEHYAGAARVQDLLALKLPASGYEVSFACVLPDQFERQRSSLDCAVHNFPMRHRLDLRPAGQVVDLIRREGFDLIHSHETRSAMIAATAAKLTAVPYIHHVHCQMNTEVGQRVKTLVNTTIERTACRCADRIIAVSGSISRFLQRTGFTHTPIAVVPNGVPQTSRVHRTRSVGNPWTIGMVALLRERKGLENLLTAFPQLRSSSDIRLRIVGRFESEAYEQRTMAMIDELGIRQHIDFTGFTRQVSEEIRRMDVLVLPSVLPEGMPMVLLEAMSAGVPIVGSRVDGITDVIRHEQNGLLTEPGSAASLAGQLNRILSHEVHWNDLQAAGEIDYLTMYSDNVMAANVAAVYDDVLRERNCRTPGESPR